MNIFNNFNFNPFEHFNLRQWIGNMLKELLQNTKRVVTKNTLLDLISMDNLDCDENSLKVHISNIRKKMRKYTSNNYIEAVWGIGFKIKE